MTNSGEPILVVGGGFGGLTAALALGRQGIPVQVFEGAPEFGAIGYGIQFGPNIFHVFERLGLKEKVLEVGDVPEAVMMLDGLDGSQVTRIPTGAGFGTRFKHPYLIIHRIDLHNVLLDACRASDYVELVSDAMVTDFEETDDGVSISTEDGRTYVGDAIVGADGIASTFRKKLFDDGAPLPNGYVAHRTIFPMEQLTAEVPTDVVILWGGPGFHIVHYPLRHGTLFNLVAVFRSANEVKRGDVDAYRAELQETYKDAHPEINNMIQMMDLERRFVIGDRDPIRRWHDGRVGLLGDAAHPTLQTLAQGACMAIEDGLHLGNLIPAMRFDYDAAFKKFTADRYLRTARVTLESRAIWEMYHDDGIRREVHFQRFRERSVEDSYQCLSWLYDGFPFDELAG